MILSSQTEEQIQAELDQDHAWLISYAKKQSKKHIAKIQKSGLIRKDYDYEYRITSPNNNKWYLHLNINLLRARKVCISCNCSSESAHGTLDYYLMRGYTFGGIYFIRVTSHTISRIKERCPSLNHLDGNQICSQIFRRGEEGSGMLLTDHRFIRVLNQAEDSKDVCILLTTSMGVFFAYQTIGHNCIIKTFISSDMINEGIEREIYEYCLAGHVFLNQKLFPQEAFIKSLEIMSAYRTKYGTAAPGFCFPE